MADWYSRAREEDGRTDDEVAAEIKLRRDAAPLTADEMDRLAMSVLAIEKAERDTDSESLQWSNATVRRLLATVIAAKGGRMQSIENAALRKAAREFIENHDGDDHSVVTWPCDGQCVQARALRAAVGKS